MSVFKGELHEPELKYICVDYFCKPKSRDASTFFLSHCHADHMKGLYSSRYWNDQYINDLFKKSPEATLYCSPITALFVRNNPKIRIPEDRVQALEIGKHESICVWPNQEDAGSVEPYHVDVTLLPAGHCPGSVMFLFELPHLRVLFTGDFRADAKQISALKALHFSDNLRKDLDVVYLDNTFYSPIYEAFPSRKESLDALKELIKDWIEFRKDRLIKLTTSARFGSEFLFESLSKHFGKIHVEKDEYYNFYQHIPQLKETVTPHEKESGPIHSCFSYSTSSCCDVVKRGSANVRAIKPCALSFRAELLAKQGNVVRDNRGVFKVVYSCHSSYSEIKGILDYLNPRKVHFITSTQSKEYKYNDSESDIEEENSPDLAPKKFKGNCSGPTKLRLFQPVECVDNLSSCSEKEESSSQELSQNSLS
ncbi:unnamed protein product [Bemisia tabaci]|uniref:Protein artemis n=1 Tax=Bemisia tabaci TaxID=7038 RepID=A0A9P0AGC8_BEMTA|nr:PREDICTED: protein artemis-like isoform X1 [Bemisia tabaci]CAH0391230.1 unnamed protein product [Bemisia tabaci]